jgi:hypothetical protein
MNELVQIAGGFLLGIILTCLGITAGALLSHGLWEWFRKRKPDA